MSKPKLVLSAVSFALIAATSAHAMDAATFLEKAEAVQKKGASAMFTHDAMVVLATMSDSVDSLRAERLAAKAAGRQPAYCPPAHGELTRPEILAAMRAVPAAQRPQTQVADALRPAFAKKFPCPA